MSGAIRIAADRSASSSPRLRPELRARQVAVSVASAAPEWCPPSLVGIFDDAAALTRATTEFAAAAFSAEEVICITLDRSSDGLGFWSKLRQSIRGLLCLRSSKRATAPAATDSRAEARIRQVLSSGSVLVLVRSYTRFAEACEIIQRTGGRIGL